jgi:hypothetical protein
MADFATYYRDLAQWEGTPSVDLIAPWNVADVESISNDFREAFRHKEFCQAPLLVAAGISNQSIGNKVADYFVRNITQRLCAFQVQDCGGPGYPDKMLLCRADRRLFAFELKATSEFDPKDSNRIVLTSSSQKLRQRFHPPICHLLATACYELTGAEITIERLRLDFLEPTTPVNVRLEASVSQRGLAHSQHRSIYIDAAP